MFGNEAKTIDDPEVILGLSPPTPPETHLEKRPRPAAKLGVASLVTPILSVGIARIINILAEPSRPAYTGQWAMSSGILWILGLFAMASIAGAVLSIGSLWKREGWPIFAIIGLIVNGGFLLGGFQFAFR